LLGRDAGVSDEVDRREVLDVLSSIGVAITVSRNGDDDDDDDDNSNAAPARSRIPSSVVLDVLPPVAGVNGTVSGYGVRGARVLGTANSLVNSMYGSVDIIYGMKYNHSKLLVSTHARIFYLM
jgi:hypothetical protein